MNHPKSYKKSHKGSDLLADCRAIIYWYKMTMDENIHTLLRKDFISKIRRFSSPEDPELRGICYTLAKELGITKKKPHPIISDEIRKVLETHKKKESFDVVIMTVLELEHYACSVAFDIDVQQDDYIRFRSGLRGYRGVLKRKNGKELSLLLTMVGEPTNVPCALLCMEICNRFKVGLVILVGIAAGVKDKVYILDTVIPSGIVYYEPQRLEPEVTAIRPIHLMINHELKTLLAYLQNDNKEIDIVALYTKLPKKRQQIKIEELKKGIKQNVFPLDIHKDALTLSGEKLIADGKTILQYRKDYHEKIRALDQEDYGFATSCGDWMRVEWLIFRGISDFGDMKSKEAKHWQSPAALAAARIAVMFLKNAYLKPKERDF